MTLIIMLIVSWLLLFVGVFMYERLDHRVAALTAMQEQVIRTQQSLLTHLGVVVADDDFTVQIRTLVQEGKTYEALVLYRSVKGSTYKESKAFVDSLRRP
jgi:hypothetical protein